MRLTVLGCSGSVPGPGAATSGYLVEAAGVRLVFDLGNGTLARLQEHCGAFDVSALLLSHLHADHCADIAGLVLIRRFFPSPPFDPRLHRLPVHAPVEAPTRLAAASAPSEADRLTTDLGDVLDFRPLSPGTLHIGPFEITVARMAHVCEAYGFRIVHEGRSLVYTGDTAWCPAVVELSEDADVLMADTAWPHQDDLPENLHMTGRQVGEVAARAQVGRLLLTHVLPWTDRAALLAEAAESYRGPIEFVEQARTYEI